MRDMVKLVDGDVVVVQTDAKHKWQEVHQKKGVNQNVANCVEYTLLDCRDSRKASIFQSDAEPVQSLLLEIGESRR